MLLLIISIISLIISIRSKDTELKISLRILTLLAFVMWVVYL